MLCWLSCAMSYSSLCTAVLAALLYTRSCTHCCAVVYSDVVHRCRQRHISASTATCIQQYQHVVLVLSDAVVLQLLYWYTRTRVYLLLVVHAMVVYDHSMYH